MTWLIGLALRLGIPSRFAKAATIAALVALAIALLSIGKCAYDRSIINAHEAKQDAANAKADRKADAKAAEQRRKDDARTAQEAQEVKEAVNEAGNDPAARRAAYYACVSKQQAARRNGQQPPNC